MIISKQIMKKFSDSDMKKIKQEYIIKSKEEVDQETHLREKDVSTETE